MTAVKTALLASLTAALLAAIFLFVFKPFSLQRSIFLNGSNTIRIVEPLWGAKALTVVFADTQKFDLNRLSQRIAALGSTVAIVDSQSYFNAYTGERNQCLSGDKISVFLETLFERLDIPVDEPIAVAGISDGALLPFIHAQAYSARPIKNISVAFSLSLPERLNLCPPLTSRGNDKQVQILVSSPPLKSDWLSVWTDQPGDATARFIRGLAGAETHIAPYDTPLTEVLTGELLNAFGFGLHPAPPMPVVEVPASPRRGDTATLFYSGDGGWRDLDRTVAGEMAQQGFSVVGVDVLRYFWQHKSPEQAAADLSATMSFYRHHWGVNSFVLAGYSFGADILPAVYNRLPPADQNSVPLLVLLALADHADFEIHVSGWLGREGGELALAPELAKMPKQKLLCVYGIAEKNQTACTDLANSEASLLELPGGHHFDQDYPKLTRKILDIYRRHGIQ